MIDSTFLTVLGMSTFDERLAHALESAGKSAADLAQVLRGPKGSVGASKQAVHQALSGSTKSMTAENVALAARFLGCDAYWLATGENSPDAPDHTWPFDAFTRHDFEALTERQKGEVERAALDAMQEISARTGNRAAL